MMSILAYVLGLAVLVRGKPTPNALVSNNFAGVWNLTQLKITYRNGSFSQPLRQQPYGRLVLTLDGYFISQFNAEDYGDVHFHAPPALYVPGTPQDNADVVRNSLALSGTYELDKFGEYLGLRTTGATIPGFIDSTVKPPNSTFKLTDDRRGLMETLTSAVDRSTVRYLWSRLC